MKIETKFDIGDMVHYLTQELVPSTDVCQCCKRPLPSELGVVSMKSARVIDIYIFASGEGVSIDYTLDSCNMMEDDLFTSDEAKEELAKIYADKIEVDEKPQDV